MKTRDKDIRELLHQRINDEYKDDPSTIVIDEFNLCLGFARIDIAVVNGSIHGYEIKSDSDTLERLPNQMKIYNEVMDTITLVIGKNHVDKALNMIPDWWGVTIAEADSEKNITFNSVRKSKNNPDVNAASLVQLLWKDEALNILKDKKLEKGYLSKPKRKIWERLATSLPLDELQYLIREQLKNRKDWRADPLQK